MAKIEIFTCDRCGAEKRDVNRWWMLSIIDGELILLPWKKEREKTAHKHFCGQTCVIQAVNKFMSDLGGK